MSQERQAELERASWGDKLRSPAAWSDAASYTMADITMLRRELVIGYAVAGALAVLVPMRAWADLFLTGHGVWTSVENVVVGPFIAFISFVCSIGNVPMAAALWHGGISFGGVISFIFADLIALPLVLIYRKYYGNRLALRLFVTEDMVGHKLGEFAPTRIFKGHSGGKAKAAAAAAAAGGAGAPAPGGAKPAAGKE